MDELIDELAKELGVPYRTRLKWRQRGVSHHRREDIRDLAEKRGITISRDDFDNFGHSCPPLSATEAA
jgi:hypothetical protein